MIATANQQQLHRIAVYGARKQYAGKSDAVEAPEQNLDDSESGDAKLTGLARSREIVRLPGR